MVAMFGWIMPAPLAMPVTVIVRPSITTCRETALGTVSVVMIASAALGQLSAARLATPPGSPASMRSTGSGSMITPVDNGSTCAAGCPAAGDGRAGGARVASSPGSPVPALASPVLTTSARIWRAVVEVSRQTLHRRGAEPVAGEHARHARALVQLTSSRSLRFGLADVGFRDAQRTPATGNSSASGRETDSQVDGHSSGRCSCRRNC